MHLYITEQGTYVRKRKEHLIVCREKEVLEDVLFKNIDSLILFGMVHISTDAMTQVLDSGADVAFLSRSGHFRGRLQSARGKNIFLRQKQFESFRKMENRHSFAQQYVCQKLLNGFAVLEAYHKNPHNPFIFHEKKELSAIIQKVKEWDLESIDTLRGLEGYGSKIYFQGFSRCFLHGIEFPGRKYHPSTDPVNALLSFGYSFVAREIEALLESHGLDPYFGFYHELSYGRASLSLDIMEEFRHPLVDRLVLKLFNRQIITPEHFETRESGQEGQLYLKRDASRIFLKYYEEACDEKNRGYGQKSKLNWRQIFHQRIEMLRAELLDGTGFTPFQWDVISQEI